ncbi:MAG: TIM barrel protein [Gemmobacter sp.]
MPPATLRFSANLGLLFTGLPLPDAIRAAARAGFDAVECHFPRDIPTGEVRRALDETGLPMLSLNTSPGDRAAGEFGLAALPGREAEARAAIAGAVDYAAGIGCPMVHVMPGIASGPQADRAFRANLAHACDLAAPHEITVLIEPINPVDVPGYHLASLDHAAGLLRRLDRPNLRIMFDCYHIARISGGSGADVLALFTAHRPDIGHVQFAAVPDRGEPDRGGLRYDRLLPAMAALGWTGAFGAEYHPRGGDTLAGLDWLAALRAAMTRK